MFLQTCRFLFHEWFYNHVVFHDHAVTLYQLLILSISFFMNGGGILGAFDGIFRGEDGSKLA